jgi:hypothetical protein
MSFKGFCDAREHRSDVANGFNLISKAFYQRCSAPASTKGRAHRPHSKIVTGFNAMLRDNVP